MKTNTFRLKVLLMDDYTNDIYVESGLRGVRREDERYGTSHEFIDRTFKTEDERQAYIDALYDMSMGCFSQYAILDNRCRNF